MRRYIYFGIVVLIVILYMTHLFQQHKQSKQQASDILHDVRSYVGGVRDVFEQAPGEPVFQQYGLIREGTGILLGFNKTHSSSDLVEVARFTRELESELFSILLQNKFNDDRAFVIDQLTEAYQGMPETMAQLNAASLSKLKDKLHKQHVRYMYKKYNSYG
ncbi:hypothetical protein [Paenibacillus sp. OV219]|uniref:hypothetical protein n=1 Tax=Paenibacillus sp. OV219 TaxID=1884377 RepID=UPI000B891242|nr:hypothetical protein [Paenibacillus sp. OV219]